MKDRTIKELLQAKKISLSCGLEDIKDTIVSEINSRMEHPFFSFDNFKVTFKWTSQIRMSFDVDELNLIVYIPAGNCTFTEDELDRFMMEQGFIWATSQHGWKMDID